MGGVLFENGAHVASTLLGCFVHDLRNRLQMLVSSCAQKKAEEEHGDVLSDIEEGLLLLWRDVENFLSLIRRKSVRFSYVSIRSLLEDIARFTRPFLRDRGVRLRIGGDATRTRPSGVSVTEDTALGAKRVSSGSGGISAEVFGEPSLLRSAILNLIVNAVEAGAKEVVVAVYDRPDCVVITVDDDGHPFDSDSYGLGLASVEFVAKLHNGSLITDRLVKVELRISKERNRKIDFYCV